jgi:hypothetical protein
MRAYVHYFVTVKIIKQKQFFWVVGGYTTGFMNCSTAKKNVFDAESILVNRFCHCRQRVANFKRILS